MTWEMIFAAVVFLLAGIGAGNVLGAIVCKVADGWRNRRDAAWPDWQEWEALEGATMSRLGDAEFARARMALRKLRDRQQHAIGRRY